MASFVKIILNDELACKEPVVELSSTQLCIYDPDMEEDDEGNSRETRDESARLSYRRMSFCIRFFSVNNCRFCGEKTLLFSSLGCSKWGLRIRGGHHSRDF